MKIIRFPICVLLFLSGNVLSAAGQQIEPYQEGRQTLTIENPILQGFYPDPSIERVGDDYYLVNSTFAYFPGLPIFHSRDLKNWKLIGHAIDRSSQLNFIGQRTTRALFAPAIAHHKGIFYIVCTDVDKIGNFVITATDPAGPWSDPVPLPEVSGIDPSLYFEDDKAFLVYNSEAPDNQPLYDGHRTIKLYAFDYDSLRVRGEPKILVNGGVDLSRQPVWIEGPHLYKRGDYYYLCAAEGGTSLNHSQVIFRGLGPEGPFEPWDKNPILTQRDLDPGRPDPITATGHADLFIGPDDNWYTVFLGIRPYEEDYYNIGRETFIAPVTWTPDGWPVIVPAGETVKYHYTFNWKEEPGSENIPPLSGDFRFRTDFSKGLDGSFIFLRDLRPGWLETGQRHGLSLSLLPAGLSGTDAPAFVARRLQHFHAEMTTRMVFDPRSEQEDAGIVLYQNESHYYYMAKTIRSGKTVLQLRKGESAAAAGYRVVASREVSAGGILDFRVDLVRDQISFYFSVPDQDTQNNMEKLPEDTRNKPGNTWIALGESQDARHLSTSRAGGFVGTTVGLYASSNGGESSNSAQFRIFEYTGKDRAADGNY